MLVFIVAAGVCRCTACGDAPVADPDRHAWDVHDVFPTAVLVVTDGNPT